MKNLFITTELELRRLGQNINTARKRRKMNVSELSVKSDVSRQVVMRIEKGDPSVGISKVFNVLNALGLLNGISSFVDPDVDRAQAMKEIKEIRESSKTGKSVRKINTFSKDELNF